MTERHPGGRTCQGAVPLVLVMYIPMVLIGLWKDRHNLGEVFKDVKGGNK